MAAGGVIIDGNIEYSAHGWSDFLSAKGAGTMSDSLNRQRGFKPAGSDAGNGADDQDRHPRCQ